MTIPFALVVVFIMMHFTKMPANLFSLGAIDFGIIVDGAIVVTEAILRRREADPTAPLSEQDVLRRDQAGGAADLLRHPHHHHRLSPAVRLRARRGQAVLAHGLYRGLCPVRRALCTFTLIPGLAYMAFRKPRRGLPQPAAGMAQERLSPGPGAHARRAEHRLLS